MKVHQHQDYQDYIDEQVKKNTRKLDNVWVKQAEIDAISRHILKQGKPAFGICHGVRNAWEVQAFRKALGCEVIGTDIAKSVSEFNHTILWDFHDDNPDWYGKADFIYSNSLDHTYDLDAAISSWRASLKPEGMIYIHHGDYHSMPADGADCLIMSTDEMRKRLKPVKEFYINDPRRTIFILNKVDFKKKSIYID